MRQMHDKVLCLTEIVAPAVLARGGSSAMETACAISKGDQAPSLHNTALLAGARHRINAAPIRKRRE